MKIQACAFVAITDILSAQLTTHGERCDFWERISDNAPFSWGDNNRSLITASCLADHCQDRLSDEQSYAALIQELRSLGELYIDLES